ncbi:MAG: tetratricopeptide repeat protein [marine benthic group bacterium]|nr:tetratricopeptide repeat protein [Gemmatimonadota bacterium]
MRRAVALVALVLLPAACGGSPDDAVERGDRLYGAGQIDAAIAEYRLALRQRGDEPEVLLRLGDAYGEKGEVEASLRYIRRLLAQDSTYRFQAAAVLSEAARVALERGAPDNMARALGPVERMGVGLIPPDLRLSLARHYSGLSDHGRALPLYLGAAEGEVTSAEVELETARTFQELGGCREALGYFESYLGRGRSAGTDRSGVRWQYGNCLFVVAEEEQRQGRSRSAEAHLDALIAQGVPRTLLDRAHFDRGEMLLARGAYQEAESDFLAVLELNPARSGPLVAMAEERIREIRYGYLR